MKSELEYYNGNWNADDEEEWQKKCERKMSFYGWLTLLIALAAIWSFILFGVNAFGFYAIIVGIITTAFYISWNFARAKHADWGPWGGI